MLLLTGCAKPAAEPKTSGAAPDKPAAVKTETAKAVPSGVPVLMYHSVGDEPDNEAVISPKLFAEHMRFLHQEGYQPISLEELYGYLTEKKPLPLKPVVLTFDDGYRDTYETVLPVLKKYGFKSTMFIPVAEIGRNLTLKELQEMKAAGMEIASHSLTHRDLSAMSPAQQAEEIARSKQELDRLLAQDTRFFCYPYGTYNAATLKILRENGFKLSVTINPGWVKPGDDPLILTRVWMGNSVDLAHFAERVSRANYSIL